MIFTRTQENQRSLMMFRVGEDQKSRLVRSRRRPFPRSSTKSLVEYDLPCLGVKGAQIARRTDDIELTFVVNSGSMVEIPPHDSATKRPFETPLPTLLVLRSTTAREKNVHSPALGLEFMQAGTGGGKAVKNMVG